MLQTLLLLAHLLVAHVDPRTTVQLVASQVKLAAREVGPQLLRTDRLR